MTVAVGSLWATEPVLPVRTQAAFGLMIAASLTWAVFAGWVLARRRVLFGADRVLAAGLGLAFALIGAVGMAAIGYETASNGMYLGAAAHGALAGIAVVLLVKAKRRVAALSARRQELAQLLSRRRTTP
jgi:hypothetical protein